MCMAIPSRVVALSGLVATVECFGTRRDVSLMLLGDDVRLGDHLLVQAGGYAYEKVDPERAAESLALLGEILAEGEAVSDGSPAWLPAEPKAGPPGR